MPLLFFTLHVCALLYLVVSLAFNGWAIFPVLCFDYYVATDLSFMFQSRCFFL